LARYSKAGRPRFALRFELKGVQRGIKTALTVLYKVKDLVFKSLDRSSDIDRLE